jgi:hypothetical protein
MCVAVVLKVHETEVGELKTLHQPFSFINQRKKENGVGKKGSW